MEFKFTIGYRQSGVDNIAIKVKYILKCRQINFSTVINAVSIDLIDGNDIINHWVLWLLVPVHHSSSQYFRLFWERFIKTVLITDSVLYSIGALELMKFQNRIEDHHLSEQEKATLEDIRNQMLSMNITFIEHEDLFFGNTSFNDESELAMFRYKDDNKNYVSDEELSRELGRAYVPPRSQLTYESDRQIATERILERPCKNCGIEITNKSEPTLSMLIRFCLCDTLLHNIYNFNL